MEGFDRKLLRHFPCHTFETFQASTAFMWIDSKPQKNQRKVFSSIYPQCFVSLTQAELRSLIWRAVFFFFCFCFFHSYQRKYFCIGLRCRSRFIKLRALEFPQIKKKYISNKRLKGSKKKTKKKNKRILKEKNITSISFVQREISFYM